MSERAQLVRELIEEVNTTYKGNILLSGDNVRKAKNIPRLPTGIIQVDEALGGGFPFGKISLWAGEYSTGKTQLAMRAASQAHLFDWKTKRRITSKAPGEPAYPLYVDAENALDYDWAELCGVDLNEDRALVSQTESSEQCIDVVNRAIQSNLFACIIVDSLAALAPEKEILTSVEDQFMGVQARLLNRAMRMWISSLTRIQTSGQIGPAIILINQLRCVSLDTLVVTQSGIVPAGSVTSDDLILNGKGKYVEVSATARSRQKSIHISLEDGRDICCGYKHPLLSISDSGKVRWKAASQMQEGDWVAQPYHHELPHVDWTPCPLIETGNAREISIQMPDVVGPDLCQFLGMWYSDGSMIDSAGYKFVAFTENNLDRRDALSGLLTKMDWHHNVQNQNITIGSQCYRLLTALGCKPGTGNKTIPDAITGRLQWIYFLRGFFDTHFTDAGLNISFKSERVAKKVQLALFGLGIRSRVLTRSDATSSVVGITSWDLERYTDLVGFSEPSKAKKAESFKGNSSLSARGKKDVIPSPNVFIDLCRQSDGWKALDKKLKSRLAAIKCSGLALSRIDYEELRDTLSVTHPGGRYYWQRIKSIVKGPEIDMIDFDVPDGRSFMAGGMTTHNTNIGTMFGDNRVLPGGKGQTFASSIIGYSLSPSYDTSNAKSESMSIVTLKGNVQKNKTYIPRQNYSFNLRLKDGDGARKGAIDNVPYLISRATSLKLIKKKGGKYTFGTDTFSTQKELKEQLQGSPALQMKLYRSVIKGATGVLV